MNFEREVINIVNIFTAKKVTDLLYSKKYLTSGEVVSVDKKVIEVTFLSYIIKLNITYSSNAEGKLDNEFLLKVSKSSIKGIDNSKEISYYNKISNNIFGNYIPIKGEL